MLKKEELIKSEQIFKGKLLDIRREIVRVQNGREAVREIACHPGGVCVAAVDNDMNVITVTQYRRPFDDFVLELPAGKREAGEEALTSAVRELREETGCTAEKFTYLGDYFVSPGFTTEVISIYLAEGLCQGEQDPDEDEFLEIKKIPLQKLLQMVMNNEIYDAKTAIGILKAARYFDKKNGREEKTDE